ncbi:MAG TPA: YHYH protein [Candidatus Saccharimonadales bacterium]|nr:YHYH protein [Candidatus Saccharimonadales bacterium]
MPDEDPKMPPAPDSTDATAKEATQTPAPSEVAPADIQPIDISKATPSSLKIVRILLIGMALIVVAAGGFVWMMVKDNILSNNQDTSSTSTTSTNTTPSPQPLAQSSSTLTLDTKKNYGNEYASGLLPVGDSKYITTGAKKGYIYACNANFVSAGQAGAQVRGPWFTNNNTQWDINKKAAIMGKVTWQPSMSVQIKDGKRIITTNDLPTHATGVFPVASSDPARVYDANPNTIKAQSLTYSLAASPAKTDPSCMGGEVGVMLTGVALFDGFDAGGRDAGAWEVQDGCDGHPQNAGEYHYHTLSRCITDTTIQTVIGYALDGFPITGPKVGTNNMLTTDDLDECHGITSEIILDGKKTTSYHYVMTQDFPYSVSCFRAAAIRAPGIPENAGGPRP